MGYMDWRFPETKTRGNHGGRQELPISRDPWHHHPVPKLQARRQEQVTMGDKDWQVPPDSRSTIWFPICKTGGKRRYGRKGLAISK